MPLHIIRQDITKMQCDAIVNAANTELLGGGGVDGAIHRAAGSELLQECITLGGCQTGDAKITNGYNLPCKYVIHTVGPVWIDGKNNEHLLLKSCYQKSLMLAKKYDCKTLAFPLISSGLYGYPKDKALSIAIETISDFLIENEMTVYLVVFDKTAYQISQKLFYGVKEYIDDNYVGKHRNYYISPNFRHASRRDSKVVFDEMSVSSRHTFSLDEMLSELDDNFAVTLLKLIDIKGMTDVECYKRANVSRQTWYKIMNEKDYKPSKNTVISFAIALKLSLEETKHLLSTVGFAFSKSSKFDIIIEYFLLKGEYNIFTINETLFEFDQVCLGM